MAQTLVGITNPFTFRELKEFAATGGPALTVYMPTDIPGGPNRRLAVRLSKLAGELEARCAERGIQGEDCAAFLAPFQNEAEAIEAEAQGPSLVLLRSPETFRYFWLPRAMDQEIHLADNFHVRPILDLLQGDQTFYILGLSQKDWRLLKCTEHSSEEVPLSEGVSRTLSDFLNFAKPDHNLRNNSSSGPGVGPGPSGRMNNVSFGTATDKEHKDEYLYNYFNYINKVVSEKLNGENKTPVVLAGVEFELAIYRSLNVHQNLCAGAVHGAMNGLSGAELHTRALEAIVQHHRTRLDEILAQHDKQGKGVADAPVSEIVKAAYDGRVNHLLAGDTAQAFGNFDEATHRVREHRRPVMGDEDLINAAAIQTVLHAGEVHVLPAAEIPGGRSMAAVMRY